MNNPEEIKSDYAYPELIGNRKYLHMYAYSPESAHRSYNGNGRFACNFSSAACNLKQTGNQRNGFSAETELRNH